MDPKRPYIPVFVPCELLGSVYRLLADAADSVSSAASESVAEASPRPDEDNWSGSADERFRNRAFVDTHLVPRSDTIRGAAMYLAQRPGTWLSSDEIAGHLGLPYGWNSLAGAFGAAGTYFSNREIAMPWDWTYHDTPDGRIRLRMPQEIAQVVLEAL
jgi:hypothetical protein